MTDIENALAELLVASAPYADMDETGRLSSARVTADRVLQRSRKVVDEIDAERGRQCASEGYTHFHDDEHGNGELARAAAFYALYHAAMTYKEPSARLLQAADAAWPWRQGEMKIKWPRRNLIRAAALLVAEIERLDRKVAMQPVEE